VPTVTISTEGVDDGVEVRIADNGAGIPEEYVGKVFEPFFTTKPTGFGNTGLGLSLSHDIVSKGHGGSMRVEAGVEEGAEFIVSLPLQLPV
jgi:signal transduction histidine kinase